MATLSLTSFSLSACVREYAFTYLFGYFHILSRLIVFLQSRRRFHSVEEQEVIESFMTFLFVFGLLLNV